MRFQFKDKNIGELIGKTFYKYVKPSRHLYRKLDAWGINLKVFDKLPPDGILRLKDTENNVVYTTTVARMKWGLKLEHKPFGWQILLPRKLWDIEREGKVYPSDIANQNTLLHEWFDTYPVNV